MNIKLRSIDTPKDVLQSLAIFNSQASKYPGRTKSILRSTQYWVFDSDTEQFGPGKFVGYRDMNFDLYEESIQGESQGVTFDGHLAKASIERAFADTFKDISSMHGLLIAWGTALIGEEAFGSSDTTKWRFLVSKLANTHLLEATQNQERPTKNPPWQRDELILALELYVRYQGKPPSHNHPDILKLSQILNALPIHESKSNYQKFRNQNGVYLKLMNFRRFDPTQSGIGMSRGNKLEKEIWDLYANNYSLLQKIARNICEGYLLLEDESYRDQEEDGFREGRVLYRLHRSRERSKSVIQKAKEIAKLKYGRLFCSVCKFDFAKVYGSIGEDYIEGHHTKPISELTSESQTKVNEIALLCSNCHRMVHRYRPWLSIDDLNSILKGSE